MKTVAIDELMKKLVIATLFCVTLFVSPWNSTDPINLPKMFLFGVFGFSILGFFLSDIHSRLGNLDTRLLIFSTIFSLQSLLTFLLTKTNWAFKFYGTPGRNTGFLTYFLLTVLLISTSYVGGNEFSKRYLRILLVTGSILGLYGIAQSQGHEIFNYVTYYSNNVFGTFGNSNFHSAFMGITGSAALTLAIYGEMPRRHRFPLLFLFLVVAFNIFSSSSQGYLSLTGGFLASSILFLFQKKKLVLGSTVLTMSIFGFILFVLSVFNMGPFARYIYEASLQARGFYWQAALQIIKQHPFLGVGFDAYGNWFNRSRSLKAFQFNPDVVSDSAHNVPLDIGASGGVTLLLAYLAIQMLVLRSVWIRLKSPEKYDVIYLALFSAWVAYEIQSLLSINQIGLGVWGWSLTGLLIGYGKTLKPSKDKFNAHIQTKSFARTRFTVMTLCILLGTTVSVPPYAAGVKFYSALQSGDFIVLESSAYLKPYDRSRFFNVALILKENNRNQEALKILLDATRIFPDYYSAWLEIRRNPSASVEQRTKAEKELERLEPRTKLINKGIQN